MKQEQHIQEANTVLEEKEHLIQRLSFDNQALRDSTSWRITKPIRLAMLTRRAKKAAKTVTHVTKTHGAAYTYKGHGGI